MRQRGTKCNPKILPAEMKNGPGGLTAAMHTICFYLPLSTYFEYKDIPLNIPMLNPCLAM